MARAAPALTWPGNRARLNSCVVLTSTVASITPSPPRMNYSLSEEMSSRGVDLLVLEGMGRAIHTNLYTRYSRHVTWNS